MFFSSSKIITARRLDRPAIIELTEKDILNIPGSEWAIFRLASKSTIVSIDVDTNHFKGNAPEYVTIEGTAIRGDFSTNFDDHEWTVILDKIKLQPHKSHSFKKDIKNSGPFSSIKITMAPDGGISRVRVFGQIVFEKPEIKEDPPAETTNSNTNTNADSHEVTNANANENADTNADKNDADVEEVEEAEADQCTDTNGKSDTPATD